MPFGRLKEQVLSQETRLPQQGSIKIFRKEKGSKSTALTLYIETSGDM